MNSHEGIRMAMAIIALLAAPQAFCGVGCVDYWSAAADGLVNAYDFVATCWIYVMWIVYALAALFSVIAATMIYIKMIRYEQNISKDIALVVGACLFLIGSVVFLPRLFGYYYTI